MRTKRNFIQICLLGAVLLSPSAVVRAQFTFTTNTDNTLTLTGYTGSNGVVMIPGTMAGMPVTSIGDWAFYSNSVTNVLVPDGVTNIGDGAFFDCESLTNVTLGNGVADIGDWAFGFCPSLKSVCCRGNAPSFGGDNVFYGNVATIYYLPETTIWGPILDGHPAVLWNPAVPYNYTTNNGTITITVYTDSSSAVSIPDAINFLPVTCIGQIAFLDCGRLTNVTIPNSVTSIGGYAFYGCTRLTSVIMGNSVTSIEDYAFDSCFSLTNVFMGNSVTNIKSAAFFDCTSLTSVTIPNSVTSIGISAFRDRTSLTNVILGNSVTSVGYGAFWDCTSLTSATIPNSVTSIGNFEFLGCTSLTNVTIPNSVTSIGIEAFGDCTQLTYILFSGNAPSLGPSDFYADNATVYYLPGTTGWSSIFGGFPALLWNPQMQTADGSFGVQNNCFGFNITGSSNLVVVVEASTNLVDWQSVQTETLIGGEAYFGDAEWTNYPGRYYRLRSP
jgi:hypothetical protein